VKTPNSSAWSDWLRSPLLVWLSRILTGALLRERSRFIYHRAVANKKHDDTTIKLDMDLEHALKKAMDAGPYPAEKPKSRPSRSAPRTKSTGRPPAPKAD
jgi:hypothetical protein